MFLKQIAHDAQLHRVVLATHEGLLIAGSSDARPDAQLAALAPLADEGPERVDPALAWKITMGRPIMTWPVTIRGRRLLIAGLGQPTKLRRDVGDGLDRILAPRACAPQVEPVAN
ncbi:MAG: hypothetical protein H6713_20935 [Myxococcales bacterium]|nr:hypothetical protein [Myxococcales bacterium]MCB9752427.1 hypothetical protein [Myxococcales bacterium]